MSDANLPPDGRSGRRTMLGAIVAAGTGLVSAALAGLVGLVAAPATPKNTRTWRKAAAVSDLTSDEPLPAVITERHEDGWYETKKQSVVFIDKDGNGYRALSATCAHLGCRVHWNSDQKQFQCPCHGGVYDRQGNVVAGPPPRGLERLNVRVNPQTSDFEVEL